MPPEPAIAEEQRLGVRCPLTGLFFFLFAGFIKVVVCLLAIAAYQHLLSSPLLSGQDMSCPNPPSILQVYPSPIPPGSQYPDQLHSTCIIWSERDFHVRECSFIRPSLTTPQKQLTQPDLPGTLPKK